MAAGKTTALAQTYDNYPTRFSRRSLGMESEQLSAAEEAMLYASCRPERKKPKPKRRLKSRWSRGFVPNLKKKKPVKEDESGDDKEEEEDEENEQGEEEGDESTVVENGVLDDEEKMDEGAAGANQDSVQENCVDDKSKSETMLNNHCSDNESVQSGEVSRTTRSGRQSRKGSQSSETPLQLNRTRSPPASITPPSTSVRGRRSRGSSPRVPETSPSEMRRSRANSPRVPETSPAVITEVNHEDADGEKTLPNGPEENSTCNSVSEDAQTSSLDPPSSLDNDTVQEQKERDEDAMETEEAGDKEENKEEENGEDKGKK